MKNNILLGIAIVCAILLASCGGGGGSDSGGTSYNGGGSTNRTYTYNMDVNIDAKACSQTIKLSNLNTEVTAATSSASWLTPVRQPYSSGSPTILIEANENTSPSSRSCTITVTAKDGNKVIVTVYQKETSKTSEQPKINDEVSDQQPYSTKRAVYVEM